MIKYLALVLLMIGFIIGLTSCISKLKLASLRVNRILESLGFLFYLIGLLLNFYFYESNLNLEIRTILFLIVVVIYLFSENFIYIRVRRYDLERGKVPDNLIKILKRGLWIMLSAWIAGAVLSIIYFIQSF